MPSLPNGACNAQQQRLLLPPPSVLSPTISSVIPSAHPNQGSQSVQCIQYETLPNPADSGSNSEGVHDFNFDFDIDSGLIDMDINHDEDEPEHVRPAVSAQDDGDGNHFLDF